MALQSASLFSQSDRLRKAPDFFSFDLQTATLKPAPRVAKAKAAVSEQGEAQAGKEEKKTAVPKDFEVAQKMCECVIFCCSRRVVCLDTTLWTTCMTCMCGMGDVRHTYAVRVGMRQAVPLPARDVGAQKALRLKSELPSAELPSAEEKECVGSGCSCGDGGIAARARSVFLFLFLRLPHLSASCGGRSCGTAVLLHVHASLPDPASGASHFAPGFAGVSERTATVSRRGGGERKRRFRRKRTKGQGMRRRHFATRLLCRRKSQPCVGKRRQLLSRLWPRQASKAASIYPLASCASEVFPFPQSLVCLLLAQRPNAVYLAVSNLNPKR